MKNKINIISEFFLTILMLDPFITGAVECDEALLILPTNWVVLPEMLMAFGRLAVWPILVEEEEEENDVSSFDRNSLNG